MRAEAFDAGPELDTRLLRQAEKKIGEVEVRVQAGKHEAAARVRIEAAVGANVTVVAADTNRVRTARLHHRVADRERLIGSRRRRDVAQAAERAECELRRSPVERIARRA